MYDELKLKFKLNHFKDKKKELRNKCLSRIECIKMQDIKLLGLRTYAFMDVKIL